jgi:hypothetical protein
MELLLWMWFYDSRWFFNFKISVKCYKYAWLLPLFIHLILAIICFYLMHTTDTPNCEETVKLWLLSRAFFYVLISLNIIVFILKIQEVYEKENSYFENAKKIYPYLDMIENTSNQFDYWIRRKSLISTSGVLLLFLGIISLFWSYLIINLYYFENRLNGCDEYILALLNFNSFLIFAGNVPLFVVIFVLILVKLGSFISAYACPGYLIYLGKLNSKDRTKYFKTKF